MILWSFGFGQISQMIDKLKHRVAKLESGEDIAAVVDQAMYAGSILSRVGLDFRLLLHPMFEECVRRMFQMHMDLAIHYFRESLAQHNWALAPDLADIDQAPQEEQEEHIVIPPSTLLRHAPLASFTNDVLEALNHIRHVAFVNMKTQFMQMLHDTLAQACRCLAWCSLRMTRESQKWSVFRDMCREASQSMVPHLLLSLQHIYGSNVQDPIVAKGTLVRALVKFYSDS